MSLVRATNASFRVSKGLPTAPDPPVLKLVGTVPTVSTSFPRTSHSKRFPRPLPGLAGCMDGSLVVVWKLITRDLYYTKSGTTVLLPVVIVTKSHHNKWG